MTPPIAFIDCETTGVHPGRRPWEIAIIRREPTGDETTKVIGVQPPSEEDRHTALGDALWAQRLYDAITGWLVGSGR